MKEHDLVYWIQDNNIKLGFIVTKFWEHFVIREYDSDNLLIIEQKHITNKKLYINRGER